MSPVTSPLAACWKSTSANGKAPEKTVPVRWERDPGIPSSTGGFLVSDGWDYLRFAGFDSLGDYHGYGSHVIDSVDDFTAARRMVILASVPEMVVR